MRFFNPRRLGLYLVIGFYLLSILAARDQIHETWIEFDKNLEASLLIEGRLLADWLEEDLDPFSTGEISRPDVNLTGASWITLNGEGEIDPRSRFYPDESANELSERTDLDKNKIRTALDGESSTTALERTDKTYRKQVYYPVSVSIGDYTEKWVLVGEAGGDIAGHGYFNLLFQLQGRYWWTAVPLSLFSLVLFVWLFRGIIRTGKMEQALREAEESIELESLSSTLAHEVRNPLSIIQSCAEIIARDESLSPDGDELVSDIVSEVRRAQDVLIRHLHPERHESTELEDLAGFCRDFWEHRKSLLATNTVSLDLVLPDTQGPLAVQAVPEILERLFENLLRNSLEAIPDGGNIRFELSVRKRYAEILFRDSGPGFRKRGAKAKKKTVLSSAKHSGKGVGLRLIRKWVSRWGGRVKIRNYRRGFFRRIGGAEVKIRLRLSK